MNKYNAKKVTYDGIVFDSQKECDRYKLLVTKQEQGLIKDLKVHIPIVIIEKNDKFRKSSYIVDFLYTRNDEEVYEDVKPCKSMVTDVFKLKQKLMYSKYGIYVNVIFNINKF